MRVYYVVLQGCSNKQFKVVAMQRVKKLPIVNPGDTENESQAISQERVRELPNYSQERCDTRDLQ